MKHANSLTMQKTACQGLSAWPELLSLLKQKSSQWLAVEGCLEIGCALRSARLVSQWDYFGTVSSLSFEVFQSSLDAILKRQGCNHGLSAGRREPKGECCAWSQSRYLHNPAHAPVSLKGVITTGKTSVRTS